MNLVLGGSWNRITHGNDDSIDDDDGYDTPGVLGFDKTR